jgi:hypothetical protein
MNKAQDFELSDYDSLVGDGLFEEPNNEAVVALAFAEEDAVDDSCFREGRRS